MTDDPLLHPDAKSRAADIFTSHFGIDRSTPPRELLAQVARAFARIPYENLTKILKEDREGKTVAARRHAEEVMIDHRSLGAGGTCFSLTAALLHVLRALGFRAEPILADRRYGENTHSALLVWVDDRPCLLDPGFLIVTPVPLTAVDEARQRFETAFNEIELTTRENGARVDLYTVQQGHRTYRLTFKTDPADRDEFLGAWDASFDWDMMRYPLVTRVVGDRQLYLQERRLQTRSKEGVERVDVGRDEMVARIASEFGIDASVAGRALAVLDRRGEGDGKAPRP